MTNRLTAASQNLALSKERRVAFVLIGVTQTSGHCGKRTGNEEVKVVYKFDLDAVSDGYRRLSRKC
jgi:hypothetical protein